MKCWTSAFLVLTAALPARAHFIWILPEEDRAEKDTRVQVIFSDTTRPDRPELLARIARTELFVRAPEGKDSPLKWTRGKEAYEASIPGKGPRLVGGVCRYDVVQRGKAEPFLLMYYPKAYVRPRFNKGRPPDLFTRPCGRLALEIVLPLNQGGKGQVMWQGKPLAGAEVVILAPGKEPGAEQKTDSEGRFTLAKPSVKGWYGIRARHIEARAGEYESKKYKEVRHYATSVMRVHPAATKEGKGEAAPIRGASKVVDPAATRLLADARAARVNWMNFPGFRADLAVNFDGKLTRGTVQVLADGKLKLDLADAAALAWARRVLGSTVAHRLDRSAALKTPCAFADTNALHPLGRAIAVLNDEFHSSYRIRDRQIIVVNRQMPRQGIRFTITVLENRLNEDKQFLPACFVVNTWDMKTDALRSSETHHQTWQRVGPFDLPLQTLVVTATAGKLQARTLTLSNHKLAPSR